MKVDAEKLAEALRRVGGAVYGSNYCEAAVTVGEVNGVVYRVVAMDATSAEEKGLADGPEWAQCVTA